MELFGDEHCYKEVLARRKYRTVQRTFRELAGFLNSDQCDLSLFLQYKRAEQEGNLDDVITIEEKTDSGLYSLLTDTELYFLTKRTIYESGHEESLCFNCARCTRQNFQWAPIKCPAGYDGEDRSGTVNGLTGQAHVTQCDRFKKRDTRAMYDAYIDSVIWKYVRRKILEEHDEFCEACGSENGLVVHHKIYDHLGLEDYFEDCAILCGRCHNALHSDPEKFTEDTGLLIEGHKRRRT